MLKETIIFCIVVIALSSAYPADILNEPLPNQPKTGVNSVPGEQPAADSEVFETAESRWGGHGGWGHHGHGGWGHHGHGGWGHHGHGGWGHHGHGGWGHHGHHWG